MIRIKSDKIIVGDELLCGFVYIEDGRICAVTKDEMAADQIYDFTGHYISPGFIDLHTHGAKNCSFMFGDAREVAEACDCHLSHGTTSVMPTVSACDVPTMERALKSIKEAKNITKANILGAHLEGPYLSEAQAGAQSPDFISDPVERDYTALVEQYGDVIARWTYAPERDYGGKFCRFITERGIIASPGHTDAIYADMLIAIENGASVVTHLYSGTSTVTRDHGFRRLGVIETCLLEDTLYAEIIADARHLPPELIRLIVKVKGADRVIACTDSLEITGTDITSGISGHTEFIVEDGVCKLKDRTAFAGSIATSDRLVRVLTRECGFSIPTAVGMISTNPARLAGINKGEIKVGRDADIVVFDGDINVLRVFVGGKAI